jgi:magnesium-protoporphyrin O-methyltransferase
MNVVDDKTVVREYFNATGFDRWKRIYGEGDDVNKVQRYIRIGHQQTVDHVIGWLKADGNLGEISVCDAGCGVGSLSIPLAQEGATNITASDISEAMVQEAQERATTEFGAECPIQFSAQDLETISGQYHTVICLDVLIHYPPEKAGEMIAHLSSLATDRLILSFAPKTVFYTALKSIGDFFPGPSKATRAYLHPESYVLEILKKNGWTLARNELTKVPFYFSRLLEVVRTPN